MVDSLKQGGERFRKRRPWCGRAENATTGTEMLPVTPPSGFSVTVFMSSAEPRQMFCRRLPGDESMASDLSWPSGFLRFFLNSWRKLWRPLRWNYAILTHVVAKNQKTQKTNKMTWLMKSQTCCWMVWFVWVSLYNNNKNLNLHTHNRMIWSILLLNHHLKKY